MKSALEPTPLEPGLDPARLLNQVGWVRRLARRLVADASLSEDLAQEALLVAWRSAPAGAGEGQLRAWLSGVVRNLARLLARGESRRRDREQRSARHEAVHQADAAQRAEQQRLLAEAVTALPADQRAVVVWRYLDGLDYPAIAQRAGCSEVAARKRLSRALDRLRSNLDQRTGGDRAAWVSALLPLIGPASSAGGLLMKKKVVSVAVLGAAVLLGWTLLHLTSLRPPQRTALPSLVGGALLEGPVGGPAELAGPLGMAQREPRERSVPAPAPPLPVRLEEPAAPQVPGLFGRVVFTGRKRPEPKVVVSSGRLRAWPGDPEAVDRLDRSLRIGANGGVADVLLVVRRKRPATETEREPPLMEMRDMRLEPHVLVAHVGELVSFANRDPLSVRMLVPVPVEVPHETLLDPEGVCTRSYEREFTGRVACDDLPWSRAWLHVLDRDEVHVITGTDGRFEFPELLPGSVKVEVWHDGRRGTDARVKIPREGRVELRFEHDGRRLREARK